MKCFACERPLFSRAHLVDTRDAQRVYVGLECFQQIQEAGETGYQPPKGGPKLYLLREPLPYCYMCRGLIKPNDVLSPTHTPETTHARCADRASRE